MAVSKHYLNEDKTKFNWRVVVYIPTGEYDRFGKPIKKHKHVGYFATKGEGEKAERDFFNALDGSLVELNKDATFGDVINYFLEFASNEGEYSEGTIANYKGYLNNHMEMFRFVPIKNFTPSLIQKWQRELFLKGASDHIFNGCLKLAKAAFNYAIKLKQISTNPFKDIEAKQIPTKIRKRFIIEDIKKIIEICLNEMPEFYCIFVLAILTGARLGEYSAIRPCDIVGNKIYINKQITRGKEKDRTKENASTRIIDISAKVLDVINWHIKKYNIKPNEHMFRAPKGGLMYAKWIERKFEQLLELAGYDKKYCRVHDLRGHYVDILHLCRVPTSYISRQVGHSNSYITEKVYTQILKELPTEANELMDEKIFGKIDCDNKGAIYKESDK